MALHRERPSFPDPSTGIFIKGAREETLALAATYAGEFPVVICDLDALSEEYVADLASRTRALGLALIVVSAQDLPWSIARNIGDCVDLSAPA